MAMLGFGCVNVSVGTLFRPGMQSMCGFYFLKRQEKFVFYCLEEIHPNLLHNPGGNEEFV